MLGGHLAAADDKCRGCAERRAVEPTAILGERRTRMSTVEQSQMTIVHTQLPAEAQCRYGNWFELRPRPYGHQWFGRILGLKNYMAVANELENACRRLVIDDHVHGVFTPRKPNLD
eukprot:6539986-Prymnesium_polylepis.1